MLPPAQAVRHPSLLESCIQAVLPQAKFGCCTQAVLLQRLAEPQDLAVVQFGEAQNQAETAFSASPDHPAPLPETHPLAVTEVPGWR